LCPRLSTRLALATSSSAIGLIMTRVQRLEREVKELNRRELAAFHKWFHRHDSAEWDKKIERDAAAGKLDKLAQKALADQECSDDD
jgi:hypothetical protein